MCNCSSSRAAVARQHASHCTKSGPPHCGYRCLIAPLLVTWLLGLTHLHELAIIDKDCATHITSVPAGMFVDVKARSAPPLQGFEFTWIKR